MDLRKLRELAEKATQGKWHATMYGSQPRIRTYPGDSLLCAFIEGTQADSDYCAAMNPQTALALIAVVEAARVYIDKNQWSPETEEEFLRLADALDALKMEG